MGRTKARMPIVDKVVPIPVKHGPMVHDCAITRSQVVVMDLPVTFSWWALLKREPGLAYKLLVPLARRLREAERTLLD